MILFIIQFFNIHVYMVGLGVPKTSTTLTPTQRLIAILLPKKIPLQNDLLVTNHNQPPWACNTLGPMDPDCLKDHPANIPGKKTKIALMVWYKVGSPSCKWGYKL